MSKKFRISAKEIHDYHRTTTALEKLDYQKRIKREKILLLMKSGVEQEETSFRLKLDTRELPDWERIANYLAGKIEAKPKAKILLLKDLQTVFAKKQDVLRVESSS